ncbi:Pupal cuticle protein G1A [Eumeta japonica]|uniref:Pupal cuticle protein G1A n=1 Tax=Eumeta variegata TaxID=151549 RepID=A0A4C1WMV3_EUMVA|nr:Pupal cuticle protein G1A [Eumeta japonica]
MNLIWVAAIISARAAPRRPSIKRRARSGDVSQTVKMFAKLTVVLCVAGLAAAVREAYAPAAYSAHAPLAPAVSSVSFSTNAGAPVYTKNIVSYAPAPAAELSYSAPLVAKALPAPAAYSTYVAHAAPVAAYAAAPYATQSYAVPAVSAYEAAPVLTKSYAPAIRAYAAEPIVAKTVAAYAPAPVFKSAVSYSPAPAVSHVSYKGLDTSYSW